MTQDRIAELREIKRKRSLSYEAVGHELGVHSMSVYRWLQKGVVPRTRPVLDAIDRFLAKNRNFTERKQREELVPRGPSANPKELVATS